MTQNYFQNEFESEEFLAIVASSGFLVVIPLHFETQNTKVSSIIKCTNFTSSH